MDLTAKNVQRYVLWTILSILLGVLVALAPQLASPDPINWRLVALAGISACMTAVTSLIRFINLPAAGMEAINEQAKHLKQSGIPVQRQALVDVGFYQAERLTAHAHKANTGEQTLSIPHDPRSIAP